jgi:hypothetical protein
MLKTSEGGLEGCMADDGLVRGRDVNRHQKGGEVDGGMRNTEEEKEVLMGLTVGTSQWIFSVKLRDR